MIKNHITDVMYRDYDEDKFYPITYPYVKRGLYEINVFGDIISLSNNMQRRKFKQPHIIRGGYLRMTLRSDSSYINPHGIHSDIIHVVVHRLVAWEFVGKPINYLSLEVNHADSCVTNNYYKNLEWCTNKENEHHKALYGNAAKGEKHGVVMHKEVVVRDMICLIKSGLDASDIAITIMNKYPEYYDNLSKYDYDRLRGLVSKIRRGVSWKWLYNQMN